MAIINDRLTNFTQLTGTADADTFRFLADGNADGLLGFEDDRDVIDLGLFDGLSFSDLTIRDGRFGRVIITFADPVSGAQEKITLKNNAPGFTAANLTASDFVFSADVVSAPPIPENIVTDNRGRFNQVQGTEFQDQFVFVQDGKNDGLIGFEDGRDVIDLSAIAGLSFADLTIRDGAQNRVIVEYSYADGAATVTERITMKQNAEGFFAADLTADDFIFAASTATPPTTGDDIVIGTTGDDVIDALAGNDTITAQAGNDVITGGPGADSIDGGTGTDTASYAAATAGVVVDLASGTAAGSDAAGDTLSNIENVTGSENADLLQGDGNANVLSGLGGGDLIVGLGGDDTLTGGAGADVFGYTGGGFGADRITDFEDGTDLIGLSGSGFSFAALTEVTTAEGTRLDFADGSSILLVGIDQSLIDAADFS